MRNGGNIEYIKNTENFEKAKYILEVKSEKRGFVKMLDGRRVGEISVLIGAGRMKKEDDIDEAVGIVLNKKIGNKVEECETLAYIHANDEGKAKKAVEDLKRVYVISEDAVEKPKNILEVIE